MYACLSSSSSLTCISFVSRASVCHDRPHTAPLTNIYPALSKHRHCYMSSLLTGPYKNISINHPRLPEIANMSQTPTTLTNQWASFNVKCTGVRLHLNTLMRAIQNAELRIAHAKIALEAANGHGEPTAADIQNAREVLEDARAILRSARNKLTRAEDGTNAGFRSKNRPDTPL
jgi:hypothetical protein